MFNELQKEYIRRYVEGSIDKTVNVTVARLKEIAANKGLETKKILKNDIINMLIQTYETWFYDYFSEETLIGSWDIVKIFNISYKKLNDLTELGVVKNIDVTSNGFKLYGIDILRYDKDYLNNLWKEKFENNFVKIRLEVDKVEELEELLSELGKVFELGNINEPYKENGTYRLYFGIRSLNKKIDNVDYRIIENGKLKGKIQKLIEENNNLKDDNMALKENLMESKAYKELDNRCRELHTQAIKYKSDAAMVDYYKEKIKKLQNELKDIKKNRGRKEKFTEQDKNAMLMYKIAGKSYREIAEIYSCGVGTVHNIIKK